MAIRAHPIRRSISPWLPAITTALFTLCATTEAAPIGSGAPPKPSPGAPVAQGRGVMPMAQRSADAHFIAMMIPHHEGAIAMAELALQRSRRAEVRALAERIRTSQRAENAQMRRWYRQWYGSDVPSWHASAWGHGMGLWGGMGMGMPGFSTSLEALRTAPDFDRAFLEQMIAHHRMGVMMASHAQWGTVHPELRELEATMVKVQSEEIEQMARWYQQWF